MREIIKKNGRRFSKWILAAALTGLFVFNVAFTLDFNNDGLMPSVELTFLTNNNDAYASTGSDCAGGSCTAYDIYGVKKCDACCPEGKTPQCSRLLGCTCS